MSGFAKCFHRVVCEECFIESTAWRLSIIPKARHPPIPWPHPRPRSCRVRSFPLMNLQQSSHLRFAKTVRAASPLANARLELSCPSPRQLGSQETWAWKPALISFGLSLASLYRYAVTLPTHWRSLRKGTCRRHIHGVYNTISRCGWTALRITSIKVYLRGNCSYWRIPTEIWGFQKDRIEPATIFSHDYNRRDIRPRDWVYRVQDLWWLPHPVVFQGQSGRECILCSRRPRRRCQSGRSTNLSWRPELPRHALYNGWLWCPCRDHLVTRSTDPRLARHCIITRILRQPRQLAAYKPTNYDFPKDWQKTLGASTLRYFESFADQPEKLGFQNDDLLRDGFKESVQRGRSAWELLML